MMIGRSYYILLFITSIFIGCQNHDLPRTQVIDGPWEFKNVKDSTWAAAKVPGEVHSDLYRNGIIEDPFVANNEMKLQWITKEDWEYQVHFEVEDKMLEQSHLRLQFKGLDTYATVYLNGKKILVSNNAFRKYEVDVKNLIASQNELSIVFQSNIKAESKAKAILPYTLPGGDRVFSRKPQFHYGWDWGPTLTSCGIARPVSLLAWTKLKIDNVFIKQKLLNDSIAQLEAQLEVNSAIDGPIKVEIYVNDILNEEVGLSQVSEDFSIPFSIRSPKKWWPHNVGDPYLYKMHIVVRDGHSVLDTFSLMKGLRTVELITEQDSLGESFYFSVNGEPVYAKGANYIPQHSFQSQVNIKDYQNLLDDVVEANMNMLRVWGGGIYEEDHFYQLCDEKGIMVWQDFMFACAMYPGDTSFLSNVRQEAIDNVQRLRNHSCIALWCGNNENREGWHRWGWQEGRSEEEKDEIWNNYLRLFDTLLPQVVLDHHGEVNYWESSPRYGRGNPLYKSVGDAHDWWIWHDEYPFGHLLDAVPRFMSEFGFQSFPSSAVIKYINGDQSTSISSPAFSTHQKHPKGYAIIKKYMERDFPIPNNEEDYVYLSQLLQANGMALGFEAQRRAKPYNMGTLYWQLNDCWPVVSWSSIDYLGNWKAMHYKTKRAFENLLISSRLMDDTLNTYIVNDHLVAHEGDLTISVLDFNGQVLYEDTVSVTAEASSSQLYHQMDIASLDINKSNVVVVSAFNDERSLFYLDNYKMLKLLSGDISQKISRAVGGYNIELSSKVLQKDVFMSSDVHGHFSENYFDLLPNEKKVIHYKTEAAEMPNLRIKTFNSIE